MAFLKFWREKWKYRRWVTRPPYVHFWTKWVFCIFFLAFLDSATSCKMLSPDTIFSPFYSLLSISAKSTYIYFWNARQFYVHKFQWAEFKITLCPNFFPKISNFFQKIFSFKLVQYSVTNNIVKGHKQFWATERKLFM